MTRENYQLKLSESGLENYKKFSSISLVIGIVLLLFSGVFLVLAFTNNQYYLANWVRCLIVGSISLISHNVCLKKYLDGSEQVMENIGNLRRKQ